MLDATGLISLSVILPFVILAIVLALPASPRFRVLLATGLALWFGWTAIAPRAGALAGIVLPVVISTVILLRSAEARRLLDGAFLPSLIGLHVTRLAGGLFVLLHAEGRLANPFAFVAGWGDVLSAVLAVPAAIIAYRARAGWEKWVLAWNTIGFVDFVTAVALGATSQPGTPIRLFMDAPGAALLGDMPWRLIPAYYVPLFLIIHIAIFVRLWPLRDQLNRSSAFTSKGLTRRSR